MENINQELLIIFLFAIAIPVAVYLFFKIPIIDRINTWPERTIKRKLQESIFLRIMTQNILYISLTLVSITFGYGIANNTVNDNSLGGLFFFAGFAILALIKMLNTVSRIISKTPNKTVQENRSR